MPSTLVVSGDEGPCPAGTVPPARHAAPGFPSNGAAALGSSADMSSDARDHPHASDDPDLTPAPDAVRPSAPAATFRGVTSAWRLRSEKPGSVRRTLADRLVDVRNLGSLVRFGDAGYGQIAPPSGLAGAEVAGRRLAEAIARGQRITIHGDYDFDGIAGASILARMIRLLAPAHPVDVVLPDRYTTGYGLSVEGVRAIRDAGTDLLVAVDCGITAHEAIEAAVAAGLETLVLDHHTLATDDAGGLDLPAASIVVHPRLPVTGVERVGDDEICGAAIAFKVAWALGVAHHGSERLPEPAKRELVEATTLAGLGTIADVMPLTGENRGLATLALRHLPATTNPGLRALLVESGYDAAAGAVHEETIAFQLAPRVNALGRFGSPMPALELLCDLADDDAGRERARVLAAEITRRNEDRRAEEKRIVEQAIARAEAEGQLADDHPIIVLADPGWKRGLVGPACAKLVERFGRPVLLAEACDDGFARGSARSIDGYSIHDGLLAAAGHLERFGGHAAAAGFTLRTDRVEDLRVALVTHARGAMSDDVDRLVPVVEIDCRAEITELARLDALQDLRQLAPFGAGHPKPSVLIETVRPIETRWVGGDRNTLQLSFAAEGNRTVKAVWFRAGAHRDEIEAALKRGPIDVVASPDIDHWRGRPQPKLMITDLRPSGE